ncbi:MAG: radical SAM protein [Polyangia bacterium]
MASLQRDRFRGDEEVQVGALPARVHSRLTELAMPAAPDGAGKPAVPRRPGQQPIRIYDEPLREILRRHDYGAAGVHYSLNPYRGCSFGCVYCSARPLHEYLGDGAGPFNAGPDFESRLVARKDAAKLLDETLHKKKMRARVIQLSGATDAYQPLEGALRITRACLEVCLHHGNPVAIQTKSDLILRDLDLLLALHRGPGVHVAISLSALDESRALALEPGAPTPEARLALIERLAQAGIPVGISIAPAILGLTDTDIVRILTRAKDAGATSAFYLRLRLPGLVEPQLVRKIRTSVPDRARKVVEGLSGYGTAPVGRRAHAEDPMEQIFGFTAERLALPYERGAPWPSTVSRIEARGLALADQHDREAEAAFVAPSTNGQLSLF